MIHPATAVLEAEDLRFRYPGSDVPAIAGVTLAVRRGDFCGLLGPNGAGKTTLIHVLCGLLAPASGRVRVLGQEPGAGALRGRVGFCPQELALFGTLTARENLALFGEIAGIPRSALTERIVATLAGAALEPHSDRRVDEFSGGMKRRLNLAVALLHDAEILLLDEPTVGVDTQSRSLIFDTLERMRQAGTTVLYATHYLEEAERLCDRIFIMDGGRIVLDGERDALAKDTGVRWIVAEFDAEPPEGLAARLSIAGLVVRRLGPRRFEVQGGGAGSALERLADAARQTGVEILRVESRRSTLEERFLDLTGREPRD